MRSVYVIFEVFVSIQKFSVLITLMFWYNFQNFRQKHFPHFHYFLPPHPQPDRSRVSIPRRSCSRCYLVPKCHFLPFKKSNVFLELPFLFRSSPTPYFSSYNPPSPTPCFHLTTLPPSSRCLHTLHIFCFCRRIRCVFAFTESSSHRPSFVFSSAHCAGVFSVKLEVQRCSVAFHFLLNSCTPSVDIFNRTHHSLL
jgi:hypothetical protein